MGKETITTSDEHPFWVDKKGWVNAKDLKAGDKLKSSKGKLLKISSVRTQKSRAVVYNFTVADYHTYFVSNLGVWVHNCKVDSAGKITSKSNGSDKLYIPRDNNGNPIPLQKQKVNSQDIPLPDPAANGRAHTVLGGKVSSGSGETYRQSATFPGNTWPKANGKDVPISEVHWGDHGRSDHSNPHHHYFNYIFDRKYWERGDHLNNK